MMGSPSAGVAYQSSLVNWWVSGSYVLVLFLVFLLSLPLVNPYIHGDGVGYYAYARAPLIQHNLRFEEDWRQANQGFARDRVLPDGQLRPDQYTETGYVNNLFMAGPAILWSPFLLVAHAAVLMIDHFGGAIPADGFSRPYRVAMALGTVCYGFLGLLLSFLLARKYVDERWAFLATLGIWTASSLPVYMYFNPSWSHAHSAFVVALFLWFWERTRPERMIGQWLLLGLIAGLMIDTYLPNGIVLLIPLIEAANEYSRWWKLKDAAAGLRQFGAHVVFVLAIGLAVMPTLLTRAIIFGGPLRFGSYTDLPWDWTAPNWRLVLFSSDHGLLTWTPLLALALCGLFLADHRARKMAAYCGMAVLGFYYIIASYPYWDGLSSFGNRFFVSMTPVFVFGLALLLNRVGRQFRSARGGFAWLAMLVAAFALWNAGFMFQWGTQMISPRGAISWKAMAHNQYAVVPERVAGGLETYFFHRKFMMQRIEEEDLDQLQQRRDLLQQQRNDQP